MVWPLGLRTIKPTDLFVAAIGSLAGAWGGAYAIQRIAERSKRREMLQAEVRMCNQALDLLYGVCNTCLNAKIQYFDALQTTYRLQRNAVICHRLRVRQGAIPPGVIDVGPMDLQTLTLPPLRIERIEAMLLERMSITGKARTLVGILYGAAQTLGSLISDRNAWLEEFRKIEGDAERAVRYFGLEVKGSTDARYATYVEGIYRHLDDCAMAAVMIGEEVRKHGKAVRRIFKKEFRGDIARVGSMDFSDVEALGMMPHRPSYASWETSNIGMVKESRGRRLGKAHYCLRKRWRRTTKTLGGCWK